MNKFDLLVVIYPNLVNVESVIILDPFDKKVLFFEANSVDDVKRILEENLPFCSQGHDPQIHMGSARVIEWGKLTVTEWDRIPVSEIMIKTPKDIDESLR